jgi:hypothetical protein
MLKASKLRIRNEPKFTLLNSVNGLSSKGGTSMFREIFFSLIYSEHIARSTLILAFDSRLTGNIAAF